MHDNLPNMVCEQLMHCITYTKLSTKTPLYDARTYQNKRRYNAGAVA